MDLLRAFRSHLVSLGLPSGRALVAVSGGPDSMALLDLLVRTAGDHALALVVAHADHGIHPDSAQVATMVAAFAAERKVPCETRALALGPAAGETAARVARYAWLAGLVRELDARLVLTGHHADDQAETVLMRALAGSGPAGLAGMPAVSGPLVRPLLPFRRVQVLTYVRERGLPVWMDPANADPAHLRSWLRVEVLPLLRRRLPEVDARLLRLARHAGTDRAAWDAVLERLPGLDIRAETDGISVAGVPLADYDSALAEAVVRALARRVGCPVGPVRAARALGLLRRRASGTRTPLGAEWEAALDFGRLRLVRRPRAVPEGSWSLAGGVGEGQWGRWRLRWCVEAAPERQARAGYVAWFTPESLEVRGWKPGERVRPLAGAGRRLVVRCFQDARVPRSRREHWPVIARDGAIVWIPGVCRSDALLPAGGAEAVRIDAEYA